MKIRKDSVFVVLFSLSYCLIWGDVPNIINYQATFLDSNGKGLEIRDSIFFSLYDRIQGGTMVWQETHIVETKNGFFSVPLGLKVPIHPDLFVKNDSLFLGVAKNNEISSSRIKLNSVPFSMRAAFASNCQSAKYSDSSHSSKISDSSGYAVHARYADSILTKTNIDTVAFSKASRFSDSSRACGTATWELSGTTLKYLKGNIGIGTDSIPEKLCVNGKILVQNESGDSRIILKSNVPSVDFNSTSGKVTDSRAKIVYANDHLYVNMWDSDGANEIIGVLTVQRAGTVLEARGNIQAENFIVNGQLLNVPDYVFSNDYNLLSLDQLAKFVEKNHHLPNIPRADEIRKNGLSLSQINLKLLEKIEELTLYIIRQEKRITTMERKLTSF